MEAVVVLTLQGPFRGVPSGLGRFARGWGDAPDPALHTPAGPVFQARRRQLLAAYGDVPIGDFARVVDVSPLVVPADGRAVADRDGAPCQAEQDQQHGQHAVTPEPCLRSPFEPLPHSGERGPMPFAIGHKKPSASPPHAMTSPRVRTLSPPHVRDPSGRVHAGVCGPRISPPVQVRSRGEGRAPSTQPYRPRPRPRIRRLQRGEPATFSVGGVDESAICPYHSNECFHPYLLQPCIRGKLLLLISPLYDIFLFAFLCTLDPIVQ